MCQRATETRNSEVLFRRIPGSSLWFEIVGMARFHFTLLMWFVCFAFPYPASVSGVLGADVWKCVAAVVVGRASLTVIWLGHAQVRTRAADGLQNFKGGSCAARATKLTQHHFLQSMARRHFHPSRRGWFVRQMMFACLVPVPLCRRKNAPAMFWTGPGMMIVGMAEDVRFPAETMQEVSAGVDVDQRCNNLLPIIRCTIHCPHVFPAPGPT